MKKLIFILLSLLIAAPCFGKSLEFRGLPEPHFYMGSHYEDLDTPSTDTLNLQSLTWNNTAYSTGKVFTIGGEATQLYNSTSDWVTLPNPLDNYSGDLTLDITFYSNGIDTSHAHYIINSYELGGGVDRMWSLEVVYTTNYMRFYLFNNTDSTFVDMTSDTAVVINTETRIVVERYGTDAYMWMSTDNGALSLVATDTTASGTINNGTNPMVIGCMKNSGLASCRNDANQENFSGYISEVGIWLTALYEGSTPNVSIFQRSFAERK